MHALASNHQSTYLLVGLSCAAIALGATLVGTPLLQAVKTWQDPSALGEVRANLAASLLSDATHALQCLCGAVRDGLALMMTCVPCGGCSMDGCPFARPFPCNRTVNL